MDDPLLSIQEQSETALREIRTRQDVNPLLAAQIGTTQATGMLLNIVVEMTAALSPDEQVVIKEALGHVTEVLSASRDAVQLIIE